MTQTLLPTLTPLFCRLSYMATLLIITLHAKYWDDGNAFIFQKSSNKFPCCASLLLFNFLYADFTVSPLFHHHSIFSHPLCVRPTKFK